MSLRGWIKPEQRIIAALLAVSVMVAACGGSNFAGKLRSILATGNVLVDSLVASGVIKAELRDTYVRDFEDLAQGAARLKDGLDACSNNACKLDEVDRFQILFFDVERRGHFKVSPKLQNVEVILKAIIVAAKAYYAPPSRTASAVNQEAVLKAKLKELQLAMKG